MAGRSWPAGCYPLTGSVYCLCKAGLFECVYSFSTSSQSSALGHLSGSSKSPKNARKYRMRLLSFLYKAKGLLRTIRGMRMSNDLSVYLLKHNRNDMIVNLTVGHCQGRSNTIVPRLTGATTGNMSYLIAKMAFLIFCDHYHQSNRFLILQLWKP